MGKPSHIPAANGGVPGPRGIGAVAQADVPAAAGGIPQDQWRLTVDDRWASDSPIPTGPAS